MSENIFDLAIIGSGPGGYIAAIRAAQLGMKVACIESHPNLGGTCLNVGCIPSKALLQSTEAFEHANHQAKELGLTYSKLGFDLKQIMKRKSKIVSELTSGIAGLMKKNKVEMFEGKARFTGQNSLHISGATEADIRAHHIIIATGSKPIELSTAPFDKKGIVSSTEALSFEKVPKHLVVIGGGVIGLELGSVWQRLGAKVTVIEAMKSILSTMDSDIVRTMTKSLKKQGMQFLVETSFQKVEKLKNDLRVHCEQKGQNIELTCDKLLVAVGRRAHTDGLGLDSINLPLGPGGKIEVNDRYQTAVPGIYAIGDVISGPMLAHKAEEEGVACVEMIAGKAGHVNYDAIPSVIYTSPEVASVGKTEEECRDLGISYQVGKFPLSANARAKCAGPTVGFVKIIADSRTDKILGAHLVGPHVSEIVGEIAVGVEFSASAEDLGRSVHAHPTMSEAVKEACLAVGKKALNI